MAIGFVTGDQPHVPAVAVGVGAKKCGAATTHLSICASVSNPSANVHLRHKTERYVCISIHVAAKENKVIFPL
jgi:hypothetical protein